MSDRLYIAAEVTRRLNYIRHDTLELARWLHGETLSEGFHESLLAIISDLQRLADATKPGARAGEPLSAPAGESAKAEEKSASPEESRALEGADAA